MRPSPFLPIATAAFCLLGLSGCGYHTLGAATHLPPDIKTLAVPVFATRTEASGTEQAMTEAVIREFAARTRFRVTPNSGEDADAVLHGTILKQVTTPLTYNSATQQSSSFLITIVASVTLTDHDGKVLYQNKNYVFREQYQSTTNLPTFIQEDPAAIQRLSREFARQLVADVLEGF
jgi:outer membrane lipopolysaccharide assembly protein LptE/RlpB